MPPVGRRPAERNVYSFVGTLVPPPEFVLDTSFVVEALIPTQPRHDECRTFLELMGASGCRVIYNRFLEPELWETAFKIALKELHPTKRANQVRHDGRTLRRAKALRAEVAGAWAEALTALDWVVVELAEVAPWIPTMMGFGLPSYDAIHAATAAYTDVSAFVTMDFHFAAVPASQLQLWVPPTRVRPCRERRRARRRS